MNTTEPDRRSTELCYNPIYVSSNNEITKKKRKNIVKSTVCVLIMAITVLLTLSDTTISECVILNLY